MNNVLYVHSLHENLVSDILLNNVGLKTVARDDKAVISHNGVFVRKGCLNGSFFILNLSLKTMNGNASSSGDIIESINLWHGMLGHFNFTSKNDSRVWA